MIAVLYIYAAKIFIKSQSDFTLLRKYQVLRLNFHKIFYRTESSGLFHIQPDLAAAELNYHGRILARSNRTTGSR